MKYECLILDHDDTIVDSTRTVNFPAFLDSLSKLRPGVTMTCEDYFKYNYKPGFTALCFDILKFSEEEMHIQENNWQSYIRDHAPVSFDGIHDLLWRYVNEGGTICVISHSMKHTIIRDYKNNDLPEPSIIYGWELPPEKRKPSTWPVERIIKELHLNKEDVLLVDDLLPGVQMARDAHIDACGAGWAHEIKEIKEDIKTKCTYYVESVKELEDLLFEGE